MSAADKPQPPVLALVDAPGGHGRHQSVRMMLERALTYLEDEAPEAVQAVLVVRFDYGGNRGKTLRWSAGCDLVQALGVLEYGKAQLFADSDRDD